MAIAKTPQNLILLVEDNPLIAEFTVGHLEIAGYKVVVAESGEQALDLLRKLEPVLIVLDVILKGHLDGYEVCRRIREGAAYGLARVANVPVLMLSACAEEADRIDGFSAGVDDYLTKPFNPVELVARARAIIRRATNASLLTISMGDITIDLVQRIATVNDEILNLTPKEFELLHLFASNQGKVLPRTTLLQRVWGYNDTNTRTVDVHVQRLREKLAQQTPPACSIETEWGVGYKLVV